MPPLDRRLAREPEPLKQEEVEPFLEYVFSAIARRPARLDLREGAAVARYLKGLAWETEPGQERVLLERLSEAIWGMLAQYAPVAPAGPGTVVKFLERHAGTYFAGYAVDKAISAVRRAKPPGETSRNPRPPALRSARMSVSGDGPPQWRDDLSERIYAAYQALRQAGVRGARARVAAALNRRALLMQRGGRAEWTSYEVYERVKEFRKALERRWENAGEARPQRGWIAEKWVTMYRTRVPEPYGR